MLIILIADGLLDHFDDNFIDFDNFFGIKFIKAKLHSLIKDLGFDEIDEMIPLFFFIGELLDLDEEVLCFRDEHLEC